MNKMDKMEAELLEERNRRKVRNTKIEDLCFYRI
jgi:hypothetical protein